MAVVENAGFCGQLAAPGGNSGRTGVKSGSLGSAPRESRATSALEGADADGAEGNLGAVRRTLRGLGATPRTSEADSGNLGGNPEGLGGSAGAGRWGTGQPGLQQGVLDRWRTD